MTIAEYQAEITELKKSEGILRERLESASTDYIRAAQPFIAESRKKIVDTAVAANPQITEKLHSEGRLTELKKELNQLLDDTAQNVTDELGKDHCWVHREELPKYKEDSRKWVELERKYDLHSMTNPHSHPQPVDNTLRRLIGSAGELLIKYGYEDAVEPMRNNKHWERNYTTKALSFVGDLSTTGNMKSVMDRYIRSYKDLFTAEKRIQELEDLIATTNAKNLWEAT